MARDRQRAKRRQAERRAERLREGRPERAGRAQADGARATEAQDGDGDGARRSRNPRGDERAVRTADGEPDPAAEAKIAAAAPPEETGRSDTVVEAPPPGPSIDTGGEGLEPDPGRAGRAREPERGRVAAFLVAVWAELQRVQWPNRKTLVTLTGVVLAFVVVMGAYLGGLDWVFSRLVQALL